VQIAVIPARGGSKRIANKNIKLFAGQPLIAYSIVSAVESGLFDDVVVSTDSAEIAKVATHYGASYIIERPTALADDYTGTTPVVRHAVEVYEADKGAVDYVCCIYATAPFLQINYLQEGLARLQQAPQACFAFSVTSFAFPIQRAIRIKGDGVEPIDATQMGKRSQDLEECYHDAGQFYWGTKDAFLSGQRTFAAHSIPIILPRHLVQDIDTLEDWQRAELMYKAYMTGY
jgi:N-acylneuraminate cytidylyltransferase